VSARSPRLLLTGARGQRVRSLAAAARQRGWPPEARARAREGRALRVVEDQVDRPTWTGTLAEPILDALGAGARRGWSPEVRVEAISTGESPRPAARPGCAVLSLKRARELGSGLPHWCAALRAYLDAGEERSDA
jgi:dTDP-4-dehydrorhamnose reductase